MADKVVEFNSAVDKPSMLEDSSVSKLTKTKGVKKGERDFDWPRKNYLEVSRCDPVTEYMVKYIYIVD